MLHQSASISMCYITVCIHQYVLYHSLPPSVCAIVQSASISMCYITVCLHQYVLYYSLPPSVCAILQSASISMCYITVCHHQYVCVFNIANLICIIFERFTLPYSHQYMRIPTYLACNEFPLIPHCSVHQSVLSAKIPNTNIIHKW